MTTPTLATTKRLTSLLTTLIFLGLAAPLARGAPVDFDIPSQPAPGALRLFIQQSGAQVMFVHDELKSTRGNAVVGRHEPRTALSLLLKDTGFAVTERQAGWFGVVRARAEGTLEGSVRHAETGKPFEGARIVVAGTGSATTSDTRGRFTLSNVPAGVQTLIISAEGMRRTRVTDVTVRPGGRLSLNPIALASQPAGITQMEDFVVSSSKADGVLQLDRYEVTGERLPQIAGGNLDLPRSENDALPFTVLTRDDIVRSGVTDLATYLRREVLQTDAVALPPTQDVTAGLSYAAPGSTNLNLNGFGFDETVILVNGRRLPNVQVQNSRYPADVNALPIALIERIEILPASASALYGDNAVGGVINIVLRPNMQATEVALTYNNGFRFDAPTSSASIVHGRTLFDGKLQVRLSATFNEVVPVRENEVGYYTVAEANARAAAAPPALTSNVWGPTPNIRTTNGSPLFSTGTTSVTSVAPGATGTGGIAAFAGREGVRSFGVYDGPTGTGTVTITGDGAILSADSPYDRPSRQTIYAASLLYQPWPRLEVSLDSNYSLAKTQFGTPTTRFSSAVPASAPTNPFGKEVTVSWIESLVDLEDYTRSHFTTSTAAIGFLLKLPEDWRVSLDGQYSQSGSTSRFTANLSSAPVAELVARGVINPFRDTQVYPPPSALYDTISRNEGHKLEFSSWETVLRVTNHSLRLPTGTGSIVTGGTFRKSDSENYESSYRLPDGTVTNTTSNLTNRTNEDWAAFAELRAPLVPQSWLPKAVRAVEGDLGWRYSGSDTYKKSPNPPTLGFKVTLAAGLSLRGSYTSSFKPPLPLMSVPVTDPVPTSTTITDPKRGGERTTILQDRSPNPNLVPEEGTTRTFGLVFQRGRIHQLRASVDYFDTEKVNELSSLSAATLIPLEDYFPDRVVRSAPTPGDTYSVGRVTLIRGGYINIAGTRAKTWSGQARYAWTDCFRGTLELLARTSWFQSFTTQILPTSPVVENIGNPNAPLFGHLKYRSSFGAAWSNRTWGFGADGRYYHSVVLPSYAWVRQGADRVDRYWEFDAYVHGELTRWLPWKGDRYRLRGQLRINNVLGADFPTNITTPYGVQPYGDWRGRLYSASLSASF